MADDQVVLETAPPDPPQEVILEAGEEMPPDPGALEGLSQKKTDPRETEPPPDHPRFKEIYRKMKDYERGLAERDEVIKGAQEHNKALADKLEALAGKAMDSMDAMAKQPRPVPKAVPKAEIDDLDEQIADLEAQLAEALDLETHNPKRAASITRRIQKLEAAKLRHEFSSPKDPKDPPPENKGKQPPPPDPGVVWFLDAAKDWWAKDPLMTGAAKELDMVLSNDPAWKGKSVRDRLEEVKRQVEEKFNPSGKDDKRKNDPPSPNPKPSQGLVEPGNLSGNAGNPRVIKLTPQERQVAAGLGISDQDYAKQKAMLAK